MAASHPRDKVLLSIIVPIYNVEEYLGECLNSILQQDGDELEVILVSDCSTDSSLRIAKDFSPKFKSSKLIEHDVNAGLGPSRNSGVKASRGDYVMFLDSDDWLTTGSINKILDTIKNSRPDIAHFGCNKVWSSTRREDNLYFLSDESLTSEQQKIALLSLPSYAWLKVYSRGFLTELGTQFINIYYEDIPWTIRTIVCANKIASCDFPVLNYRQRGNSITNSVSSRHLEMLSAYDTVFEQASNLPISDSVNRAIQNSFFIAIYYLLKNRSSRIHSNDLAVLGHNYRALIRKHGIRPSNLKALTMCLLTKFGIRIKRKPLVT